MWKRRGVGVSAKSPNLSTHCELCICKIEATSTRRVKIALKRVSKKLYQPIFKAQYDNSKFVELCYEQLAEVQTLNQKC